MSNSEVESASLGSCEALVQERPGAEVPDQVALLLISAAIADDRAGRYLIGARFRQ